MHYQNEPGMSQAVRDNGCAFGVALYFGEKYFGESYSVDDWNSLFDSAIKNGIISGDLDKNGRIYGKDEGVIQSWDLLFHFLGYPLRSILNNHNSDHPNRFEPDFGIPAGYIGTCCWGYKDIQHFVVGISRPVEYDPWAGGSRTVRLGAPLPDGLRLFQVMA